MLWATAWASSQLHHRLAQLHLITIVPAVPLVPLVTVVPPVPVVPIAVTSIVFVVLPPVAGTMERLVAAAATA